MPGNVRFIGKIQKNEKGNFFSTVVCWGKVGEGDKMASRGPVCDEQYIAFTE